MTSTILHGQTQGQTNTNESETFCLGKKEENACKSWKSQLLIHLLHVSTIFAESWDNL